MILLNNITKEHVLSKYSEDFVHCLTFKLFPVKILSHFKVYTQYSSFLLHLRNIFATAHCSTMYVVDINALNGVVWN